VGNQIEKNEFGGACSAFRERRDVYRVLVGKPEGKRPLARPRSRRENNIKMDLQEVGCGGMDWIELAQGQVAGTCECGNEPSGSVKCEEFLDYLRTR
jgi:hypothetical protein